jgi:glycosyltransferase involved in cell wall biosynthesis
MSSEQQRLTVSVVIATKDRPHLIAGLFEALAIQTLPPDEVVVVDNNSRASYASVFDAFRARLPLHTFVETTPGIPAARNRGVRESRHQIIAFADDDCVPEPDWLEKLTEPFYRDPHIGAVGGTTSNYGSSDTLIERYYRADRGAMES